MNAYITSTDSIVNTVSIGEVAVNIIDKGGNTVRLTPENVADYYGEEVTYTDGSSSKTYRLFYVDFGNKYGDGAGTIYLKADWSANDTNLEGYVDYISSDTTIYENMNPQWNEADGTIDNNNERAASWLLDKTQWTAYANTSDSTYGSYVNYAVGSPSVEMYIDSYNQSFGTSYASQCNTTGYQYSVDGGANYYDTTHQKDTLNTGKNSMYVKSGSYCWWLASPSAGSTSWVCDVNGER